MPLPITISDARKILENKHSFVQQLPLPPIHLQSSDGYSYVLPSDVVELSLALGAEIENIYSRDEDISSLHSRSIFRTPFMREKLSDNNDDLHDIDIYVPIAIWSDGFDAGSQAKSNRSLVKLTTLHIPNPKLSIDHVFPIGIGRHHADHESIRRMIWDDIDFLTQVPRLCYIPLLKECKKIKFIMSYLIMDRPEHSEWTGFSSHAGLFSTVPGISCPMHTNRSGNQASQKCGAEVLRPLSSCLVCYLRRKLLYVDGSFSQCATASMACDACDDWDMLKCEYKPTPDYPTDSPFYNEVMKSKVITFTSMRQACTIIFDNIYKHNWTKAKVDKFGQVECLRRDIITSIYEYARDQRPPRPPRGQVISISPALPSGVLTPGLRQTKVKLDGCLVGLMHTLILNLGRHLVESIKTVLKERRRWVEFRDKSSKVLIAVQSMSVQWCKAWTYGSDTKPTASWVSENFLGFAILSKSICSLLPYETNFFNPYSNIIVQTMCAYNSLISQVMRKEYPTNQDCDRVIGITKLFLSSYDVLDRMISKRTTPKLETASCLANILQVGETMKRYGIMRNYWEGDLKGEGFIRIVKPLVNRGVDLSGTATSVMTKLYQSRCLDSMMRHTDALIEEGLDEGNAQNQYQTDRYRKFHAYKSEDEFDQQHQDSVCLACILSLHDNEIYVLMGRGMNKKYRKLEIENTEHYLSTLCFDIKQVGETIEVNETNRKVVEEMRSCLLLPITFHDTDDINNQMSKYYLHTEDHEELQAIPFQFGIPDLYINVSVENKLRDIESNDDPPLDHAVDITDRDFCVSYIHREVIPIDGFDEGMVSSFKYIQARKTFEDAEWTVRYTREENGSGRNMVQTKVKYHELMEILLEEE